YKELPAIIYAWFPGMEFGNALARVLSGEVSPCARLPTTFWDNVEDYPAGHFESLMTSDKKILYREGVYVGYRQKSLQTYKPRFAFGHGLTYTKFSCSVKSPYSVLDQCQSPTKVVLNLKNIGALAATETVLVFVEALNPVTARPIVELRAFAKTTDFLEPEASQDLEFSLKARDFSYWDEKDRLWRVDAGEYRIRVAGPRGVGDWRDIEDVTVKFEESMTIA
ncbi:hypothetical protein IL306_003818, partial [Fusarium sp. DS 682]